MNRRDFLTGAAATGLAASLPRKARAAWSPNDVVNVAIVGIRGDSRGQPTWTRDLAERTPWKEEFEPEPETRRATPPSEAGAGEARHE